MKILQDAGLPCRIMFQVKVDTNGNPIDHCYEGDICHLIAFWMMEEHIPMLRFSPGTINGKPVTAWVGMSVKWTTR